MRTLALLCLFPILAAAAPGYTLIGWNDLGMHCMDGDYTVFSVLPPYNTIHAQLIDPNGRLVRSGSGFTVSYQAMADATGSINTTSNWKTRFWEFVNGLFGASVTADSGLAGSSMPGEANAAQPMKFDAAHNWFTAEGIPITAYDDAGNRNFYPMMRLTARDGSGNVVATTDIVLPVSDEMDCRTCHGSGARAETRPSRGWAQLGTSERDYKLNILALHDDLEGASSSFAAAARAAGISGGLYATASAGSPVLCAKCHASNALGTIGQPGVPALTAAVHSRHADVIESDPNRSACYRCHPGSETRCLRGAMGAAVAPDGSMSMQCQNCHGGMKEVGGARTGWLEQPTCQACHTGTAMQNNGQIRYTSAFEGGAIRVAVNNRFATSANAPAAGLSLYRFSTGHGGLQCEACHGSTHAEYPSSHANDNVQSVAIQGHAGTISECSACHRIVPRTDTGGPHGMHPVGQEWVRDHGDVAEHGGGSACRDCHGGDYRGTVLSRAFADRTLSAFGTRQVWRGFQIGCYMCHRGPGSDDRTSNRAPLAANVSAPAAASGEASLNLSAPDPDGNVVTFRIVSQPGNGTVALVGGTSAVYRPYPGFEGSDSFTYAAWDGSTDSNLATGTMTVSAASRPAFAAEGVVNAASFQGGGIAPGEMVTIFGTGLAAESLKLLELNTAGLLSRSLAGVRVLFDGMSAPLIHATATQVTAMAPYAISGKAGTSVQVEYGGIRSAAMTVPVRAAAPGLFARSMNGTGQGAILNQDGITPNSAVAPAARGSVVSLFATGEGMTDRVWIDGQLAVALARPALPVTVLVGGVEAVVTYAGSAPGMVTGFMQINVQVPESIQPGDAVPVVVRIGDTESQPGLTMAVR
jgi:uncharacterized protein (TIGR03437 family)